jgi:short-subunit dehydrogenase
LNVVVPLRLNRAAAENFIARVSGTIVNIASVLARAPDGGTYSGTSRSNPEPDRSRSST